MASEKNSAPTWSDQPTVAAPPLTSHDGHHSPTTSHAGSSSGHQHTAIGGHGDSTDQMAHKENAGQGGTRPGEKSEEVKHKVEDLEKEGFVLVGFEDGDKENPRNWSTAKKWFLTCFCSYLNVCVASQASSYSTGSSGVEEEFGISAELATVGLSLYVLGFALGPPLVAPLSEQFGRKPVYLVCWCIWWVMSFPIGFSPTIEGVLICRFIAGLAASPPLANTGGVISDLWARDISGNAMAIYTWGSTIGPAMGNACGGFIAPTLGWRYIYYIQIPIFFAHIPLIYFALPETRHNIILERKAKRLNKEDNTDRYVSVHATEKKQLKASLKTSLTRPIRFLFFEPIVSFAAYWNGYLYGMIFLFNDALPEIWGPDNGGYGWSSAGLVQLTFFSLIVGCTIGVITYPFTQEKIYQAKIARANQSIPEARMFMGCFGCVLLPVGLFLTAWTAQPGVIHWFVPLIGVALFGLGFFYVLFGILSYLTDSYSTYSASALGAAVLVRNIVGAIFPLFASYMYANLGNHWATSLVGFLSLPLIPITWAFYLKGRVLREKSPWARAHFDEDEDAPH